MLFSILVKTVSEANRRDHWAVKAKRVKGQREAARLLTGNAVNHKKLLMPLRIRLTRVGPRLLDDDNLESALKACRDGIADALGVNDGSSDLHWEYSQEKGKVQHVSVQIESL